MMPRFATAVAVLTLGVAAALVFTRLGHYPLWGDEADTVIFARGVWETGDTSAWYGDNLYAYRSGSLLDGFVNRATPPGSYYVLAPFWGAFGDNRFALRLPFALFGFATVGLVLRWAYVRGADRVTFCLLAAATALNVSVLLYSRQCRYYSLGMFLTVAIGYLYDRYAGRRSTLWAIAAGLGLLASVHYLNFAAVAAAVVVDYVVRGRSRPKLSLADWAILVVPTALVLAGLVYVYNPLGSHETPGPASQTPWLDKLKLLAWTIRDMNRAEYGLPVVMAAAPLVAWARRSGGLARLFAACLTFVVVTTGLSPQPIYDGVEIDIRYLAPVVVPCIALTVLTLTTLAGARKCWAIPAVAVMIGCNLLHVPWGREQWRSTLTQYVQELRRPRAVATAALSNWLRANVPPGGAVGMVPTDWLAPQIVAVPELRYGWQFDLAKREGAYADLPDVLFVGGAPVDVLVVMGIPAEGMREFLDYFRQRGWDYEPTARLGTYYDDRTRPELIWHWFQDRPYDEHSRDIYLYRLNRDRNLASP